MNALIAVGLSKLPYWIRLHFVSTNSSYLILQSRVVFTGGEKGEVDKGGDTPR